MKRILIFLALVLILTACNSSRSSSSGVSMPSPTSVDLPLHTVADYTSLAPKDGRRIEIHVRDPGLTKAECRLLINAYKEDAGSKGQVSVRKPDSNGELLPWCVINMDDPMGIFFNDYHFE